MIHRALKEWDAICSGLAVGRVSVLVRKAGILDPDGPIEAGPGPFALFPTYEHQRAERLKADLASLVVTDPAGGRTATVSLVAEASEERMVTDVDTLRPIDDVHALTREHVLDRIVYGRRRGVRAILVRVSRLARPVPVEMTDEIRGCVSWIELPGPIDAVGARPVLTDADFGRIRARFLEALG